MCGTETRPCWRLPILGGRHEAQYDECPRCHVLQVSDVPWLPDAYAREGEASRDDPDTGRLRRAVSACLYLMALDRGTAIDLSRPVLDYGGGHGLLTQLLNDVGVSATTVDAFIHVPLFASANSVADLGELADGSVGTACAMEVVEHLVDPVATLQSLRRVLAPDGTMVVSTGLYRSGVHGPDWHYLAPEWGQHITLWSEDAIDIVAGDLGFTSVGHFPGNDGFLIVLSPLAPEELRSRLGRAVTALDSTLMTELVRRLDFQTDGVVVPATPTVRRAGALQIEGQGSRPVTEDSRPDHARGHENRDG